MKKQTIITLFLFIFYSCTDNSRNISTERTEPEKQINQDISVYANEENTNQESSTEMEPPIIVQGFTNFTPQVPSEKEKTKNGKPPFDSSKPYTIKEAGKNYEGKLFINYKAFLGNSPYNIPFIATALGSIAEFYVDNKKVNEYNGISGEIFFRRKIELEFGYNRVPVRVIGNSGQTTEGFIEITVENTPEKIEIQNK